MVMKIDLMFDVQPVKARLIYNFSVIKDVIGLLLDKPVPFFGNFILIQLDTKGNLLPEQLLIDKFPEVSIRVIAELNSRFKKVFANNEFGLVEC